MANFRLSGTLRGTDAREVWIVDGTISYTEPLDSVIDVDGYVYPGLLDTHTHPGLNRDGNLLPAAEVRRRLEALRGWGVTAVQDCGGQQDPNEARTDGLPRVLHCGQHIAQYKRYTRYLAVDTTPAELADEAVRQFENSGGWIKIVGDWIDREVGDNQPLWPREALKDAVDAVHERGGKVTVHSFVRETVDDLLYAGVDGIEHGTGMTREHLQEAAMRGILITPTVLQIRKFPQFAQAGAKFPAYVERMMGMDAQRREHLALMVDTGVPLLMGTDTAEEVETVGLPHEILAAIDDGMPAELVIAAASYEGRSRLGFTSWEEGAPADFVVYDADPLVDHDTLTSPSAVFIDGMRA